MDNICNVMGYTNVFNGFVTGHNSPVTLSEEIGQDPNVNSFVIDGYINLIGSLIVLF